MLTRTRRRILFYSAILVFLIAVIPVLLYSLGFGISRDFKISKMGGIFVQTSEAGADVSAGIKHKRTSFLGKNSLIKNLLPGIYKVSVRKEGFWDWEKNLEVAPELVTTRSVLLVPKNPDGRTLGTTTPKIEKSGPVYPSVKKFWAIPKTNDFIILGEDGRFYKNGGPFDTDVFGATTTEILKSKKESVFDETFSRVIYWDSSVIDTIWFGDAKKMPEWQKEALHRIGPIHPMGPIRQVFFYPNWPEWLLVAMSDGVWALEMDSSGGQNSFPIYQGKKPKIISVESEKIIIFDDGNYLEIVLPS